MPFPDDETWEVASDFLRWASSHSQAPLDLSLSRVLHPFALAGIATLARREVASAVELCASDPKAPNARFAHALGLWDVIENRAPEAAIERDRTVRLQRIVDQSRLEQDARHIAGLVQPDPDDSESRDAVEYVLIELFRNALQHSQDSLGSVTVAQLMTRGEGYVDAPCVQVAVGDAGIGIHEALRGYHPDLTTPQEALEKALWPHISGTFPAGRTGSMHNAGVGLFFIAEMTKLTAGRLLIATRGGALSLQGDREFNDAHDLRLLNGPDMGFPGTLVAFELPTRNVADYHALIETIQQRATERTPKRHPQHWFAFDSTADLTGSYTMMVKVAAENTTIAHSVGQNELIPRIVARTPVILDFTGLRICTQSFAHALLYEPVRVAWALRAPIHVRNATPTIRSTLNYLESYAL